MKRLHVHLKTEDLDKSIAFYTAIFGAPPTKREADYAKWLLDDPRAHVSLSTHCGEPGFDHAGIAIETEEELEEIADRLRENEDFLFPEKETTCCYAKSNKYWARDPQGATWELFQTFADSDTYGAEPDRTTAPVAAEQCC
jgi:catechol 2,3-dioxygenase-like lactoylglutathione lyase family enzyme